jgi:gamma-glutamylcysteine synthetase
VNLDFGPDETTMAKRFLASMLLAPISGAIFNYSAFESGQLLDVTGFRQRVWRHLDPSRTDIPNLTHLLKNLNKKACVDTWLEFVMGARVVFVAKDNYRVVHENFTCCSQKCGLRDFWNLEVSIANRGFGNLCLRLGGRDFSMISARWMRPLPF